MMWLHTTFVLTFLFGYVTAALQENRAPVFLDRKKASEVISRQKRANTGAEENTLPHNLERECLEEVCNYEEAREVFQDTYRTTVCVIDKTKGCSQFCKPGYQSYECSCAWGWKLQQKEKCVPAVQYPCGKVSSLRQWDNRQSNNIRSDYEGLDCSAEECPWQALLRNSGSSGFCSGVIIKENFVLTTAQCAHKHADFQVAVGKRGPSYEPGEQTLYVKHVHIHPLHLEGKAENDLALIELKDKIIFKKTVVSACLPERDFAESVLMSGEYMGIVTGWKNTSEPEFQGKLRLNHLSYSKLPLCIKRHSSQVTNKMACTLPRPKADCVFSSGSPVLTLYREVFFLTGVVSQSPEIDCTNGYVLQKVSRFLPWLRNVMGSV
ncbi:Coagulation factor X [Bagarius yarrelli]|uniref:Coagulation factor X n=1 Tax=Bagarius yarrelli TaxID=175774 RepID=A0A556UYY8_BAGYA|nr:Coagulation factor X [Bagarius yarrelli]